MKQKKDKEAAQIARTDRVKTNATAAFRFKDLVMRVFKDEAHLKEVETMIGMKRTRETADDIFSPANNKRRRQGLFKFTSKEGEKLPYQGAEEVAAEGGSRWTDSEDEVDHQG